MFRTLLAHHLEAQNCIKQLFDAIFCSLMMDQ